MDSAARATCDGKGRGRHMSSRDFPPQDILVPISVGELMDKITILEIKSERLKNPSQLANDTQELPALRAGRLGDFDRESLDKLCAEPRRGNADVSRLASGTRECVAPAAFDQSSIDTVRAGYP